MHTRNDIQQSKLIYQQSVSNQLVTAIIILNAELNIIYVNHLMTRHWFKCSWLDLHFAHKHTFQEDSEIIVLFVV